MADCPSSNSLPVSANREGRIERICCRELFARPVAKGDDVLGFRLARCRSPAPRIASLRLVCCSRFWLLRSACYLLK